jgi:hypothetical protein
MDGVHPVRLSLSTAARSGKALVGDSGAAPKAIGNAGSIAFRNLVIVSRSGRASPCATLKIPAE